MKEKDLQELVCLRMSIEAMRQQFAETLDGMAAQVEALIPEDKKQRRIINGDEQKYWKQEVKSWNWPARGGNV